MFNLLFYRLCASDDIVITTLYNSYKSTIMFNLFYRLCASFVLNFGLSNILFYSKCRYLVNEA